MKKLFWIIIVVLLMFILNCVSVNQKPSTNIIIDYIDDVPLPTWVGNLNEYRNNHPEISEKYHLFVGISDEFVISEKAAEDGATINAQSKIVSFFCTKLKMYYEKITTGYEEGKTLYEDENYRTLVEANGEMYIKGSFPQERYVKKRNKDGKETYKIYILLAYSKKEFDRYKKYLENQLLSKDIFVYLSDYIPLREVKDTTQYILNNLNIINFKQVKFEIINNFINLTNLISQDFYAFKFRDKFYTFKSKNDESRAFECIITDIDKDYLVISKSDIGYKIDIKNIQYINDLNEIFKSLAGNNIQEVCFQLKEYLETYYAGKLQLSLIADKLEEFIIRNYNHPEIGNAINLLKNIDYNKYIEFYDEILQKGEYILSLYKNGELMDVYIDLHNDVKKKTIIMPISEMFLKTIILLKSENRLSDIEIASIPYENIKMNEKLKKFYLSLLNINKSKNIDIDFLKNHYHDNLFFQIVYILNNKNDYYFDEIRKYLINYDNNIEKKWAYNKLYSYMKGRKNAPKYLQYLFLKKVKKDYDFNLMTNMTDTIVNERLFFTLFSVRNTESEFLIRNSNGFETSIGKEGSYIELSPGYNRISVFQKGKEVYNSIIRREKK